MTDFQKLKEEARIPTRDEMARIRAALAPDHFSKAAYVGRVQQTERVTVWDSNGQPIEKDVSFNISWDSISQILELVRNRAGL